MLAKVGVRFALGSLLAATLLTLSSAPVHAGGSWQVSFAGTGNDPGLGDSFGFMGSCTFSGGVISGSAGRCDISQHIHGAGGSGFTCSEGLTLTAWDTSVSTIPPTIGLHTFHITGSATVDPPSLAAACVGVFPGSTVFTEADMQLPAAPGRFNLGGLGATVGEFHITVTLLA